MCLSLLAALGGGALSAGGAMISNRAGERQAADIAKARNDELRKTMVKNDAIAMQTRDRFGDRAAGYNDTNFQQSADAAVGARTAPLEAAVTEPSIAAPISGSAPEVVRSELARVMSDTMAKGKAQAKALGKVGSYGDTWFNQGVENTSAGRDIGVMNDQAQGNLGILPYLQDFAEISATKPISPLGGIMSGIGNMIGSFSGGRAPTGGMPKRPVVMPSWGGPR